MRNLQQRMGRTLVPILFLGLAFALGSRAQAQVLGAQSHSQIPQNSTQPGIPQDREDASDNALHRSMAEKQEKIRNEDRQKRLVNDTEKLLTLATQLHEDVAKTDKNILSLDVVRRAQEIEKLAHDVKERMRN